MTLRNRITLSYLILFALGMSLSVIIYQAGKRVQKDTEVLVREDIPQLNHISAMRAALIAQERVLYEFYATMDVELMETNMAAAGRTIISSWQFINNAYAGNPQVALIAEKHQQILSTATALKENLATAPRNWDLAREQLVEISDYGREITPALDTLVASIQTQAEESAQQSYSDTNTMTLLVALYSLLIAVTAAFVAYFVNRSINEAAARKRLAMFAERNPNPVLSLDWQGIIHYNNPAASKLLGESDSLQSINDLLPDSFAKRFEALKSTGQDTAEWQDTIGGHCFDFTLHLLHDSQRAHLHIKDISEQTRAQQRLQYQALHDEITQLPNRRVFEQAIQARLDSHEVAAPFAIGLISLDRLQLITNTHGYDVVDELLLAASRRIKEWFLELHSELPGARLFRFSGYNLAVFLPCCASKSACKNFADALQSLFQAPFEIEDGPFFITLSMGFSAYPEDGQNSKSLISNADAALTRAITAGGQRIQQYSDDMHQKEQAWLAMEAALRKAIPRQELALYYQPKVTAREGRLLGFEALLRWFKTSDNADEPAQLISPDQFIPLAEQTGLIIDIGQWVLHSACEQIVAWQALGHRNFAVAVNISARQFLHHEFVANVQQAISQTGIDPSYLELEITESLMMDNVELAIQTLHKLESLGLSLAIDDFGTGYSSLKYLKDFPIHKLKIDRSFIDKIDADDASLAIVKTTIDLAHHLGLAVVAEGVETETQRKILLEHCCEELQGYLISKPTPAKDAENAFKKDYFLNKTVKQSAHF